MASSTQGELVRTTWGGAAQLMYDRGFMQGLMRGPQGGVSLFNMDLIENDSPGAGYSEKGVWFDGVWGKNQARKVLYLDDHRAKQAFLVFFFRGNQGKHPLHFAVNGNAGQMDNWNPSSFDLGSRWVPFPAEWLKKGMNVVDLSCPEAQTEDAGWRFYLARADEFEHGGGNPADAGKTSFKSFDGGASWKESPFGPKGDTRAEYCVRLSLDRYVKDGWLASPVIDLWRGDSEDAIAPVRILEHLRVSLHSDVPEGTEVRYFLRTGVDPSPLAETWSPYRLIGTGQDVEATFDDTVIEGRFAQLKIELSTSNPLVSPVIKSAQLTAELQQGFKADAGLRLTRADNAPIRYSSAGWQWEALDRPEIQQIRSRENLDGVTQGSRTQFELIEKLLEYATTRTPRDYGTPIPKYPGWDAQSILARVDERGTVGMCIQFNNMLAGFCMGYGIQGRLINGMDHEMGEVWSDDYGKWVYVDASAAGHLIFDKKTLQPMSLLDLHRALLDYFLPDHPMDWMNEQIGEGSMRAQIRKRADKPPLIRSCTIPSDRDAYQGFLQSIYLRMVPRTNFYEKPTPLPLTHGLSAWPWNGYINWYDERTPPQRQYTWHTDRPQDMWPDLNRVCVHVSRSNDNQYLYLNLETVTPSFSHFEVDENDAGWREIDGDRWTWVLATGRNTLRVRAVNRLGAKGKPSVLEVDRADVRFPGV